MPTIVATFVMERFNVPCDIERPITVANEGKKSVGRETKRPWKIFEKLIAEYTMLKKTSLSILALRDGLGSIGLRPYIRGPTRTRVEKV